MGFAVFAIFAVGVGLLGCGVYWRIQHGTFCEGCKRPVYKCSCIEDAEDLRYNRELLARKRKKPFDS